ncbi:MAG: hypothetical protein ACYSUX_10145 [Planctomycetota bacterium]
MKRFIAVLIPVLMIVGGAYAQVGIENNIETSQNQSVSLIGGGASSSMAEGGDSSSTAYGGSSKSDASSNSGASVNTTSVSNYETRTPPLTVFPSNLPYWNHGGWGAVKAYFPNGPNNDERIYERAFDPNSESDMKELKGVLKSLSYESPLGVIGGLLNGVGVVFGGPDNYHHGRGFEISSSIVRARRPEGKPLLVFIDTNVDTNLLRDAGYAYVGKVSLEGKVNRNWDQVYDAAVAETLPWDVDILLVSGGMKGVTVGSNISFPGAAGAFSQANYSISLFGSVSSGVTEGKGKAILSAQGYRFWPEAAKRRRIPQAFYNKIRAQFTPRLTEPAMQRPSSVEVSRQAVPVPDAQRQDSVGITRQAVPVPDAQSQGTVGITRQAVPVPRKKQNPGVEISQELYDMAEFPDNKRILNLRVR